ncbi:MAG: phosphatase PAP2 family protein [Akkermansiaceae bacterium]|nr:phosphatase PAP2 family protein [Akkermansiaceae bacterium]MCP5551227.1 phosphatase PAP2 family protein [Akkermansiaceae bacterium]
MHRGEALVAAVMAGLVCNILRFGMGRPRPDSGLPDGFHGPHLASKYHGFPSGHATTAFATAVPLIFALPPVGAAAFFVACGVAWSRVHLNRHRPSDVFAGALLGCWFGCAAGRRLREIRRRISREPAFRPDIAASTRFSGAISRHHPPATREAWRRPA